MYQFTKDNQVYFEFHPSLFCVLRINSREPTCSKAKVIKASITYTICQSSQAILKFSSTLRLLLISGIIALAIIICILFIAFYPKFN